MMAAADSERERGCCKVYYHLDDSMPYMSEVPVPQDQLTLGDFKKVFARKGYAYFCKEWDPNLQREVKVEISHDRQHLHKSANGLIELFLLSQTASGGPSRNADTLPKVKTGRKCSATDASKQMLAKHDGHASAMALSSVAASSDLDIGGGQRVSMATGTEAGSDVQTLISRRAGEHLADIYNSTSEDPYNRTSISSSGIFPRLPVPMPSTENITDGNTAGRMLFSNGRRRSGRKQHRRKPYVASTISSESESSYSLPRIEEVKLRLQEAPLGISVASQDGSIFIYNIQQGSAAEKCGQLEIGDQIIQVNEMRFEDLNEKQALELLKKLSTLKKTITMYVAKRKRTNGESSEERKSDALSLLCETQQLDISQWVESTKQNCAEPIQPFLDLHSASLAASEKKQELGHPLLDGKATQQSTSAAAMDIGETSDEERAAYMDRRNGVGARLTPALTKLRMQQQQLLGGIDERRIGVVKLPIENEFENQAASTSRPLLSNAAAEPASAAPADCPTSSASSGGLLQHQLPPRAQQPLHAAMEPKVILRRMVEPDSGLAIRDRKWLKIPVPMSFIGDEMIDWLLENVQGFRDRKNAKAFASKLLQQGLIKHVVNMNAFNPNCYYVFSDAIIADRLRFLGEENRQQNQQKAKQLQQHGGQHAVVTSSGGRSHPATTRGGHESTTEITYMSNPSSPFFGPRPGAPIAIGGPPQMVIANNPRYAPAPSTLNLLNKNDAQPALDNNNSGIPLRTLNPPKIGVMLHQHQLPIWPISPIPPSAFNRPTARTGANDRGCESPEATTNDYASMIQGEINSGAQFDAQFDGILTCNKGPKENNNNVGIGQNSTNNSMAQQNNNPPPIPAISTPAAPPLMTVLLPAPPLPQRHQFLMMPKPSQPTQLDGVAASNNNKSGF